MQNKTSEQIIKLLANHLGVEDADISINDSISDDLHMSPAEMTDFIELLQENNFNTEKLSLAEIKTVGELVDFFDLESEI